MKLQDDEREAVYQQVMTYASKNAEGCWEWGGYTNNGDPAFAAPASLKCRMVRRAVYVAYGRRPRLTEDSGVRSTCGNSLCVNPMHLVRKHSKRGRKLGQKGKPKTKKRGGKR